MIRNLDPPKEMALSGVTAAKKRKAASDSPSGKKQFNFTQEYHELKKHLSCVTHKDQLCYIAPMDGHHHPVDREHASLWAKEISVGHATSIRPPENIMFQEHFLPASKRTWKSQSESMVNPVCAPTIHVTINTGTDSNRVGTSPLHWSPLATITAASASVGNMEFPTSLYHSNVNASGNEDFSHNIRYPPVTDILQKINNSSILTADELHFPSIILADELEQFEITHVDQVNVVDPGFYVEVIHMPVPLAHLFVDEWDAAMRRAQKGKSRMENWQSLHEYGW
ncbi:hypothetical protein C8R45DRAFT_1104286 [Mycena sanguinolenta]|nr:hypothetical protein C8R45DRAFT_1104286 [Mycena sanguinolenta]